MVAKNPVCNMAENQKLSENLMIKRMRKRTSHNDMTWDEMKWLTDDMQFL